MEDNGGGLFLLAEMAERKVCEKQKGGKEVEAERERASLFPFLKSTRYRSKVLGWPEAVARCHAMLPLVKSVCVKKLTATDTTSHHNRLLFRREDVHDLVFEELSESERRLVCEEGGKGLLVPTLDEAGRPWALVLIHWSSNGSYVLKKDWSKLVDSNGFHAHIDIEIFSFRQRTSGRLCFVIIRRSPATVKHGDQQKIGANVTPVK
ncbi:hypothetical protein EJ110_NYTH38232 [Nymphaea thermarum]|nr:hypothetical protein EJ110_NYTH38232 [Nymphaea thermarum]